MKFKTKRIIAAEIRKFINFQTAVKMVSETKFKKNATMEANYITDFLFDII